MLQLAREQPIPTEEGRFTPTQLYQACECFLTNTSMEIMPVVAVDGKPIGTGKPGPLTQKLHELFLGARERFLEKTSPR